MQKLIIGHLEKALHDVLHEDCDFLLGDLAFLLEEGAEISLVAELGDDVAVGGIPDDIVALEDIRVFEFGESFNLAI